MMISYENYGALVREKKVVSLRSPASEKHVLVVGHNHYGEVARDALFEDARSIDIVVKPARFSAQVRGLFNALGNNPDIETRVLLRPSSEVRFSDIDAVAISHMRKGKAEFRIGDQDVARDFMIVSDLHVVVNEDTCATIVFNEAEFRQGWCTVFDAAWKNATPVPDMLRLA